MTVTGEPADPRAGRHRDGRVAWMAVSAWSRFPTMLWTYKVCGTTVADVRRHDEALGAWVS